MHPVLEVGARPDTPAARRAGDDALGVGLLLVVSLLALAAAVLARQAADIPPPESSTRLPILASSSADAWDGAVVKSGRVVVATGAENGRTATVLGGEAWRDYTLRTHVTWVSGSEAAFVVRSSRFDSYVACVLEGARASIQEVRCGTSRTLASAEVPDYRGQRFDAVVTVAGDIVSFSLDGATAARARLEGSRHGTAGLAAWDPQWGRARLVADYVRVEPVTTAQRAASPMPAKGARPAAEPADLGD